MRQLFISYGLFLTLLITAAHAPAADELQDLRNNLAHSQDTSGDWNVIQDLASNLHRIVLESVGAGGNEF